MRPTVFGENRCSCGYYTINLVGEVHCSGESREKGSAFFKFMIQCSHISRGSGIKSAFQALCKQLCCLLVRLLYHNRFHNKITVSSHFGLPVSFIAIVYKYTRRTSTARSRGARKYTKGRSQQLHPFYNRHLRNKKASVLTALQML